jgi:hypothetical protein
MTRGEGDVRRGCPYLLSEKWYLSDKENSMGITIIEQIGIVAGIVIGVSGFIYSIAQARRQRKYEQEQAEYMREQAAKQDLKDRLYFLGSIIVDKDIPRKSRQVFFDEFIAKGGNGTFAKFWLDEGKELESKKQEG